VEQIVDGEGGLVARLTPGIPHVLVAHGTVQSAIYGSERTVMLGHDIVLPLSLFKNSNSKVGIDVNFVYNTCVS